MVSLLVIFTGIGDEIAKTVTVVETTNGNIFGGYTELPWDSFMGFLLPWDSFLLVRLIIIRLFSA
jgi:hypothetical protein